PARALLVPLPSPLSGLLCPSARPPPAPPLCPYTTLFRSEWAHAIAPEADILLVTTPTAEILGVQGFPQMMNAENFRRGRGDQQRSEEHTSELQSHLKHVCRLLLEKKNSNWRQLGSRITLP